MERQRKFSTNHMVLVALMAAVLCVLGPFAIPVGAVPISLTSLVLYFMTYIMSGKLVVISYGVYFLLGIVGLPVFSGFAGGPGKIAGPTGGYLIGFFLMIPLCAVTVKKLQKYRIMQFFGIVVATGVAYIFGTGWFVISMSCDLGYALTVCVLPFLAGDILKIGLAIWIGPVIRRRMQAASISLLL